MVVRSGRYPGRSSSTAPPRTLCCAPKTARRCSRGRASGPRLDRELPRL